MRGGCAAAKDGFQVGQTAKARLGPPCAVTPVRTWPPVSCHCNNKDEDSIPESARVRRKTLAITHTAPSSRMACSHNLGEYLRGCVVIVSLLNYGQVRAT
jgi:hypothetical protein